MSNADGKTYTTPEKTVIINRLKRVEGQVRGLVRMVEDGKDCGDVLIQIGSAKSALHKAGQLVLEDYVSRCFLGRGDGNGADADVSATGEDSTGAETVKRLFFAIEQFSRIV